MRNALLPLLIFIFIGCGTVKEIPSNKIYTNNITAEELISKINNEAFPLKTCNAIGTIDINFDSISFSASFELFLKHPDSLRIDISGPFGIELGNAIITQNSYLLYSKFENLVTEGKIEMDKLPIQLPSSINMENLFLFFSGKRTIPQNAILQTDKTTDSVIVLKSIMNEIISEFTIDRNNMRLLLIKHNKESKVVLTEKYYYGNEISEYPTSVILTPLNEKRSLTISFESVKYNVSLPRLEFDIDKSAERITK